MKQFFGILLTLALIGGGFWLLHGQEGRSASGQLTRVARNLRHEIATQTRELTTAAQPPAQQLSRYETLLCNLANAERKKRGLSTLKIAPALADVARGHSREMMQKGYFSHDSPTPTRRTVQDRYILKYKRPARLIAENIFTMKTTGFYRLSEADFRRAHEGWMKSPGHRANILRTEPANPSHIGVGIVVKNGSFWATQNFSRP